MTRTRIAWMNVPRRFWLLVLWTWIVAVWLLSTLQLSIAPEVPNGDKIGHFVSYGILAWLAGSRGWNKCHVWLGASLMGVTVECTQYFLPWRSFEPLDMLANCSGALLGILLVCAQQRWTPSFPAKCKKA